MNQLTNINYQIQVLQSKLKKHTYFSKRDLPNSNDAQIFILLKSINILPNRKSTPNLFHWYVIIKQFAPSILDKWILTSPDQQQNQTTIQNLRLISENIKSQAKANTQIQSFQNQLKNNEFIQNNSSEELRKFIMIIKIKKELSYSIAKVKSNITNKKNVKFTKVEQAKLASCSQILIQFITTLQQCQIFKNQVSNWSEVQGLQIKKAKKLTLRYNTF